MRSKLPPLSQIDASACLKEGLMMASRRDFDEMYNFQAAMLTVFADATELALVPFSREQAVTDLSDGWVMTTLRDPDLPWHQLIEFSNREFPDKYFAAVGVRKELSDQGKRALDELSAAQLSEAGGDKDSSAALVRLIHKQLISGTSSERLAIEAREDTYLRPEECKHLSEVKVFSAREFTSEMRGYLLNGGFCPEKIFSFWPSSARNVDPDERHAFLVGDVVSSTDVPIFLRLLSDGMRCRGYQSQVLSKMKEMAGIEYISYCGSSADPFYSLGSASIVVGDGLYTGASAYLHSHVLKCLAEKKIGNAVSLVDEIVPMLKEFGHTSGKDVYSCGADDSKAYLSDHNLHIETENGKYVIFLPDGSSDPSVSHMRLQCVEDRICENYGVSDHVVPGGLDLELKKGAEGSGVCELVSDLEFSGRFISQFLDLADGLSGIQCSLDDDMWDRPRSRDI